MDFKVQSRRDLLRMLAGTGVGLAVSRPGWATSRPPGEAGYLTWIGYDRPELQSHYRATYGADPAISTFFDSADAFERLRGGLASDVVHPCAEVVPAWREAGLIQPIDVARLRHWHGLHPRLRNLAADRAADRHFFVPWEWGEISIAYRADLVQPPPQGESWTMLWDEHNRGRIALLDSAADAWCAAALAAGLRADTDQAGEQAKLLEFMARLADNAASVTSSPAALQRDLVSGKVVAAMAWADVAREAAKGGLPVHFARPREGSLIWVCGLVLARDAPHLDMAYDLIDGMLAPDIGALCIRSFRYGHSNLASFASLSDAALAAAALPRDPSPILETGLIRVEPPPAMRADVARLWSRLQATMGDADQDGPCACGGPKAVRGRALRAARIPGVPPPI